MPQSKAFVEAVDLWLRSADLSTTLEGVTKSDFYVTDFLKNLEYQVDRFADYSEEGEAARLNVAAQLAMHWLVGHAQHLFAVSVPGSGVQDQQPVPNSEQSLTVGEVSDNLTENLSPEGRKWVEKLMRVLNAPQFAHAIQQNLDAFVLGIDAVERLANLERGHDVPGASDASEAGSSLQAGIAGVRASLARASALLEGTGAAPQVVRKKAK